MASKKFRRLKPLGPGSYDPTQLVDSIAKEPKPKLRGLTRESTYYDPLGDAATVGLAGVGQTALFAERAGSTVKWSINGEPVPQDMAEDEMRRAAQDGTPFDAELGEDTEDNPTVRIRHYKDRYELHLNGEVFTLHPRHWHRVVDEAAKVGKGFPELPLSKCIQAAFFVHVGLSAISVSRDWPDEPLQSVAALETAYAGVAAVWKASVESGLDIDLVRDLFQLSMDNIDVQHHAVKKMLLTENLLGGITQRVPFIADWAMSWMESNFAKVHIGGRLAAALASTDVPNDMEVRSPWPAWVLSVDNLFEYRGRPLKHIWVTEKQLTDRPHPAVALMVGEPAEPGGTVMSYSFSPNGTIGVWTSDESKAETEPEALDELNRLLLVATDLVASVCLSFENTKAKHTVWRSSERQRGGKKRNERSRAIGDLFQIGSPVSVDLRDDVRGFIKDGKAKRKRKAHGKGGKPTVQFLVRGHWRNQAWGPGRMLRKRKWIEPFWKGPEDTRVLVRGYEVKK